MSGDGLPRSPREGLRGMVSPWRPSIQEVTGDMNKAR